MRWFYKLPLRFRSLFRKNRVEQELNDELRFHLERSIETAAADGTSPDEARYAALRELGGLDQIKEECRDMRRVSFIEVLIQDIRYGMRMLVKSPGFTGVAVLTLALGIGVNTTLFTAFDAVALKPLPVAHPDRMVRLVRTLASGSEGDVQYAFSYPEYLQYLEHNSVFSGLIAASWPAKVAAMLPGRTRGTPTAGEPEGLQIQLVSGNYFTVLGASAAIGRVLLTPDDAAGASPVAVLSYPFWQRRLNSDPSVLGKVVRLNGSAFTVIGVARPDFIGTANPPLIPDLWTPLAMQPLLIPGEDWLHRPADYTVQLLGLLSTGMARKQARAEVTVLAQEFQSTERDPTLDKTLAVSLRPATYFGESDDARFRAFVAVLMVLVGMVLLVACANLANMVLARCAGRQQEIAIRLALGASRGRLVRQWVTESVLLAVLGGAAGLLLSLWATRLMWLGIAPIVQALFNISPSAVQMSPDLRVFGYTLALSVATGVAFGLSPALRFSRPDLAVGIRNEGSGLRHRNMPSRLRAILVSGEVAVSAVLLVSTALLVRGVLRSQTTDPGFQTRNVIGPLGLYFSNDPVKSNAFAKRVIERVADLPAVRSVGVVFRAPWSGTWTPPVIVEETKASPKSLPWQMLANRVSPGYFATLGITILRGRNFTRLEGDTGAPAAIVSELAARRLWPGEDPIGKKIKLDLTFKGNWVEYQVVGVAQDVRTANLSRIDPGYIYVATDAAKLYDDELLIRTQGDKTAALASVRAALESLDRTQFPPGMWLDTLADGPLRMQKVIPQAITYFAGALGVLALLLAMLGIYGVISYTVTDGTHEIGVRAALGASRSEILQWTLRRGMRPVLVGAAVGFTCSIGVSTILHSVLTVPGNPDFLFGASPFDATTFGATCALLLVVALAACYLPARRATKVDPMVALRHE